MGALTFPWTRKHTSAIDEIITATKLAGHQIHFHDNLLMKFKFKTKCKKVDFELSD